MAQVADRGLDPRLVVSEGPQGPLHFALDAVVQALDGVRVQAGAAFLVALETQVGEHVGLHLVIDPADLYVDAGSVRKWCDQQTRGEPWGPPAPSTSPWCGNWLRHFNRMSKVKPRKSRALRAQPLAALDSE